MYVFVQFTALPLSTVVQPQAQASFEYSFIPAQPMAGRPFGLVILLNYLDTEVRKFFIICGWCWLSVQGDFLEIKCSVMMLDGNCQDAPREGFSHPTTVLDDS